MRHFPWDDSSAKYALFARILRDFLHGISLLIYDGALGVRNEQLFLCHRAFDDSQHENLHATLVVCCDLCMPLLEPFMFLALAFLSGVLSFTPEMIVLRANLACHAFR